MSAVPVGGDQAAFVDTSGFFALLVTRDSLHPEAKVIQSRIVAQRRPLVTTNWILAELHALMLGRVGRTFALRALLNIDDSDMTIVRVGEDDERRARGILRRYEDKDFSLTDATSFVVMDRLHMTTAFTFDRHFAQFGFSILGADRA